MLDFKQALSKLQSSEIFRDYQKKNPSSYLTNSLYLNEWQINYFSPKTNVITSFTINSKIKKKTLEAKNQKFPALNQNKIHVDIEKALSKSADELSKHDGITIIIIQVENSVPVWNISIPTPSLKVINVKISAESGEILEKSEKSIIETR